MSDAPSDPIGSISFPIANHAADLARGGAPGSYRHGDRRAAARPGRTGR